MHFIESFPFAIAFNDVIAQFQAQRRDRRIVLELKPLVPVSIRVERIGFTRNASNTPYIVYRNTSNGKRCCTFIKRRVLVELMQKLLKLKCSVVEKIRSLTSDAMYGLKIKTATGVEYLPSVYVHRFLAHYNDLALSGVTPQICSCNDLDDVCLHQVAALFEIPIAPAMGDYLALCSDNRVRAKTQHNWKI